MVRKGDLGARRQGRIESRETRREEAEPNAARARKATTEPCETEAGKCGMERNGNRAIASQRTAEGRGPGGD